MNFEMMETLQFTPVEMTLSYGVIAAPWCIKPVFGLISDKFEFLDWGKRRPYIFCCGVLLSYLYMMLPQLIYNKGNMVGTMTFISFLMCFADVCADCVTVDYTKTEEKKGNTQSACWTSRAIGSVCGSMFGGTIYRYFGTKTVFQIMALPCLLMSCGVWYIKKKTGAAPDNMCSKLWKAVYKKRALAFGIFTLSVSPNYGPFYTYFLRRKLNFNPEDFQWISMASAWAFLAATLTYKTCLLDVNPLRLMKISIYCSAACQLIQLFVVSGVSTSIWLIVFDTIGESLFGMLTVMPLIVVIAHNAKKGVEGTFYALLMSVSNLSAVVADEFGGLVGSLLGVTRENFDNMTYLIVICAACNLILNLMVVNNKSFVAFFETPMGRIHQVPRTRDWSANNRDWSENNMDLSENNTDSLEIPGRMHHRRNPAQLDSEDEVDYTPDLTDEVDHTPDLMDEVDHTPDSPADCCHEFVSMVMPPGRGSEYRAVPGSGIGLA